MSYFVLRIISLEGEGARRRKGERLFGELVIAYLFLAGLGAGGAAAASLADLLLVREPFGAAAEPYEGKTSAQRMIALVFAASLGALSLGAACLLLDVGRLDRVLALFLAPQPTVMVAGAWALTLLGAVLAVLTLARFLYLPWIPRKVVAALEVVACVLAAVVAVYAGLLLQANVGVRLWTTPWLPVLFVLSAASCGCALVLATALFVPEDEQTTRLMSLAARVDAMLIGGEVLVAALFLARAATGAHPGLQVSAALLMDGDAALAWWVGFVLCGLVLPLGIEAVWMIHRRRNRHAAAGAPQPWGFSAALPSRSAAVWPMALAAALVLVGAAGMRTAVVEAGQQRPLELQAVEAPASTAYEDGGPQAPATQEEREDASTWLS